MFHLQHLWLSVSLRIEEPQNGLRVLFAQICAGPHMADDCSGDTRGESLRSIMTAGAVLLKDALPIILLHRWLGNLVGRFWVRLRLCGFLCLGEGRQSRRSQ